MSFYACRLSVCTPRAAFSFAGNGVKCAGQLTEHIETGQRKSHVERPNAESHHVLLNSTNDTQEPEKREKCQNAEELFHSATFFHVYGLPCFLLIPTFKLGSVTSVLEVIPDFLSQQQACGSGLGVLLGDENTHGSLHNPIRI